MVSSNEDAQRRHILMVHPELIDSYESSAIFTERSFAFDKSSRKKKKASEPPCPSSNATVGIKDNESSTVRYIKKYRCKLCNLLIGPSIVAKDNHIKNCHSELYHKRQPKDERGLIRLKLFIPDGMPEPQKTHMIKGKTSKSVKKTLKTKLKNEESKRLEIEIEDNDILTKKNIRDLIYRKRCSRFEGEEFFCKMCGLRFREGWRFNVLHNQTICLCDNCKIKARPPKQYLKIISTPMKS